MLVLPLTLSMLKQWQQQWQNQLRVTEEVEVLMICMYEKYVL